MNLGKELLAPTSFRFRVGTTEWVGDRGGGGQKL